MALEKELETYKANLPSLLAHQGKFVLIQGDKVGETFTAYEDAIDEGYRQFGLTPFMVKQILSVERVQQFTRLVRPHSESRAS